MVLKFLPVTLTPLVLFFTLASLSAANPIALQATDLANHKVEVPSANAKATVVVFIVHDCPICNRYAPEINRIESDYGSKGVALDIVYTEEDLSASDQRQHAEQYGFQCTLLRDPKHTLSRQLGARITPQAVVLSSDGTVLYRGRIDNSFISFGMSRPKATTTDLRDVLDKVVAGTPVSYSETKAIGCYIPND